MSQKIVPKGLRLYYNKDWDAQWMAKNKDYSKLLFLNINFKNYIFNVLKENNLNLLDVQLKKNLNNFLLYIYINFEDTRKKTSLIDKKNNIEQNLNNYLKKTGLKNSKINIFITYLDSNLLIKSKNYDVINKFFKKMFIQNKLKKSLTLFNLSILTKNTKFLSKFLCKNLERTPQHKKYLTNVYKILKNFMKIYPNFKGFKLQMKGRLNGIERARTLSLQNGRIPFNSLKYNIKYAKNTVITPYGSCSIKVWFFYQ